MPRKAAEEIEMAYCDHDITNLDGGQSSAYRTCASCGVCLPDTWGCGDCEFIEMPRYGEPRGLRYTKGQPCIRHTDWRPEPTGERKIHVDPESAVGIAKKLRANPSVPTDG